MPSSRQRAILRALEGQRDIVQTPTAASCRIALKSGYKQQVLLHGGNGFYRLKQPIYCIHGFRGKKDVHKHTHSTAQSVLSMVFLVTGMAKRENIITGCINWAYDNTNSSNKKQKQSQKNGSGANLRTKILEAIVARWDSTFSLPFQS